MNDSKLTLVMAMLHVDAIVAGCGLLVLACRSTEQFGLPDSNGGHGDDPPREPPRHPNDRPSIGPPLPGAVHARARLRQPSRLADHPRRTRHRGPREPQRPVRARLVRRRVTENMSQEERFT
jgi:hypothetical protein